MRRGPRGSRQAVTRGRSLAGGRPRVIGEVRFIVDDRDIVEAHLVAEEGFPARFTRRMTIIHDVNGSKPRAASKASPKKSVRINRSAGRHAGVQRGRAKSADTKRSAAKPKLLAGGNPQIAKADGDAPVQAYIAAMPGWKRDVGRRIDTIVTRTVPEVVKAVKWNSPLWGVEGQGWLLAAHCFTKFVRLTFFRGKSLHPPPPGESKSKDVAYLDIREGDAIDEKELAMWIRQAAALPGFLA
jgi:hypothetical protein